ncbi:MAG: hypothetical protein RIQ81_2011 [Pseudomonadota bacterium]|jgi:uncharacterized membrane protein YkvA (DUF1232 family)
MALTTPDPIIPYELNKSVRDAFEGLLRPILFRDEAFRRVESGLITFETRLRVAEHSSAPGARKARQLLTAAQRLFTQAKANPGAAFVPHVLAAIDYLVKETDEIPDFSNEKSFVDDQQVIDAVSRHFRLLEVP